MNNDLPIVAPSILAADYTKLGSEIKTCIEAGSEWIHCDIMDGHFVPNISFGPNIVEAARRSCDALLDVHLMIENPERYISTFADAGADLLTVHQEVCPHLHSVIQQIKEADVKAGVAVNPATLPQQIIPILPFVDLVLIMSVNPGFGGQSFIETSYQRLQEIRALRDKHDANFVIEVDGGINPENIQKVSRAGADVMVTGSAVFKSSDIKNTIKELTEKAAAGKDLYV